MPHIVRNTWNAYIANDRIACVFSPDECTQIVETYSEKGWVDPKLKNAEGGVDRKVPRWILGEDADAAWIFGRLEQIVKRWNDRGFNFQIDMCQNLQLICRTAGDAEGWRMDLGSHFFSRRKLSTIVVLSRPEAYAGGTIEFLETEFGNQTFALKAGDVLVFASWLQYRIHPVTDGELWTLSTCWMGNRPIR